MRKWIPCAPLLMLLAAPFPAQAEPPASRLRPAPSPIEDLAAALHSNAEDIGVMTAPVLGAPSPTVWVLPVRAVPPSEITLIALRNPNGRRDLVEWQFHAADATLPPVPAAGTISVLARQTVTRDVRQLAASIQGPGFLWLRAEDPLLLADSLRINLPRSSVFGSPAQPFCQLWQLFWVHSAQITTHLHLWVESPQGTDPGAPPTLLINVYDQAGFLQDTLLDHLDRNSRELPLQEIIDALASPVAAGSLEIGINGSRGVLVGDFVAGPGLIPFAGPVATCLMR